MGNFTTNASEMLHRYVYPPFASLWSAVRSVTGRERRAEKRADLADKSAADRRHKDQWNASHDR
jgi:hypothetical protein